MHGDDIEEAARRQYQVERRVQEMHAHEQVRAMTEDAGVRAQGALRWSVVFLVVGGVVGLLAGVAVLTNGIQHADQGGAIGGGILGLILLGPAGAYASWATYWGWLWTWRWWRRVTSGLGCFGSFTFILIMIVLFFYIPFAIAFYYGVLGGGIYQYLKAKRVLAEGYGAASARVAGTPGS